MTTKKTSSPEEDKEQAAPAEEPKQVEAPAKENTEETPTPEHSHPHYDELAEHAKQTVDAAGKLAGVAYKRAKSFEPRIIIQTIDLLLGWLREKFPPRIFDSISSWCTTYGHAGIVTAEVLCVVLGLVGWAKNDTPISAIYGIGYALLLVVLQYTADKFVNAGENLIKSSPSKLSSTALLDCTFLLLEIAGLSAVVVLTVQNGITGLLVGLGIYALLDAVAYTALFPELANVKVSSRVRGGEEAIGFLSFFAKAILKIVPIAFGIGAIIGTAALLVGIITAMSSGDTDPARTARRLIIICTCLPFGTYVLFAVYHLFIDVIRAILVLPAKLDKTG